MSEHGKREGFVNRLRASIDKYGTAGTLARIAYRSANAVMILDVSRAVVLSLDHVAPEFLTAPDEGWRFFGREELEEFAADPEADLDWGFAADAMAQGHRCYGFVADGTLAAYGWYSTQPTPVEPLLLPGLAVFFEPSYVYLYKAYTAPAFRGMRLHGIGIARATKIYAKAGFRGVVQYVDATNTAALKSCHRLGCRVFGTVLILKIGSRYYIYSTRECRAGMHVRLAGSSPTYSLPKQTSATERHQQ